MRVANVASVAHATALVLSCGFFMVCSAGMMIFNKLVLRAARLPVTVVMIQMAFTVLALCAVPCSLRFGSMRDVVRWALSVPFLFVIMLASSMFALDRASMGAIVVFRNVAPLITLAVERMLQERVELDAQTAASLVYVLGGVWLYVSHDVSFSREGLGFMLLNMAAAVLERILQRRMIAVEPIDVSKTGMMLLNNAVALLPATALLYATGEHTRWGELRQLDAVGWAMLGASCVNAVAISWAGINAQGYVTATTFMVLANMNKFAVIAFGVAFLHEARSWQAIAGCVIALSGGAWYARARSQLAAKAAAAAAADASAGRALRPAEDDDDGSDDDV